MDKRFTNVHYQSYLQLDKVLEAQTLRSEEIGEMAHDEMLFIITHQAYELWFKQILHELRSVADLFKQKQVDEKNLGTAVSRLNRIIRIQGLIIDQIRVLETMTPLDFLDFRNFLFPASGFQSFQFRAVEVLMGLRDQDRITYNKKDYDEPFSKEQKNILEDLREHNMFDLVERWLERTPFIQFRDYDFVKHYREAVERMHERERHMIEESGLSDEEKAGRLRMLETTSDYYRQIFEKEVHEELLSDGRARLSYKATIAALQINLYRDEPILHQPYLLLTCLVEMDELFTTWRYRHAQMVLRMLGKKIGTGGSSGYDYLQATANRHHIFADFHNISTLLIPRSELPGIPDNVKDLLGFHFSTNPDQG